MKAVIFVFFVVNNFIFLYIAFNKMFEVSINQWKQNFSNIGFFECVNLLISRACTYILNISAHLITNPL